MVAITLFFILAAIAWSFFNLREYDPDNRIADFMRWIGLDKFYEGGKGYNQGNIVQADFKHKAIIIRHFCLWTGGYLIATGGEIGWSYLIGFIMQFVMGWAFVLLTHYLLTKHPAGNLSAWVLRCIQFWK